jgi:serine/threonine-protein kinase PknG
MEYVGGTSLKSLLKKRMQAAGRYDALPLDQAIACVLEVLPAFQYLHDLGLVYCDFKPDNIIQVGDDIKLIDMGGVRRLDDEDSAIYGTVGYQAPEVPAVGTSIASDIYTIGRTLLVLAMEFRGYQSTYLESLPAVADTPLFQRYGSFHRLVAKACAPAPADRFGSAAELRVQLLGVLREVVATDGGNESAVLHAKPSVLFDPPDIAEPTLDWTDLPGLIPDTSDPQAGWLVTVGVQDPAQRLDLLADAPEASPEVLLETGRAALLAGRADRMDAAAEQLLAADPWDGGRSGCRASRRCRLVTGPPPRARSTPCTARCRASWHLSWPWPWPANAVASRTSPSRSTPSALAATPPTGHQPPSAWPGSGPVARTCPARSPPSTWCRPPAVPGPRPGCCGPSGWPSPGPD